MPKLTHFDKQGRARMVDVSSKAETLREAVVRGSISMQPATFKKIMTGEISKGDVLAVAKVAGIMAAKKTSDIIPMCHPSTYRMSRSGFILWRRRAGLISKPV